MKVFGFLLSLLIVSGTCYAQGFSIGKLNNSTIKIDTSRKLLDLNLFRLDSLLEVTPRNDEIRYSAAWTKFAAGMYYTAKEEFEKILASNYDELEAYWGRAQCNIKLHKNYEAIQDLNMILKITPESNQALFQRGLLNLTLTDFEAGLTDLRTVTKRKEDTSLVLQSFKRQYEYYLKRDQKEKAKTYLDSMVKFHPKDPEGWKLKGDFYTLIYRLEGAMQFYRKSIKEGGNCFIELAEIEYELNKFFECVQTSNRGLEYSSRKDSVHFLLNRGKAKSALSDQRGAITDLTNGIKISPKNPHLYFHRGHAKLLMENLEDACLDFSKAGELGIKKAYKVIHKECK